MQKRFFVLQNDNQMPRKRRHADEWENVDPKKQGQRSPSRRNLQCPKSLFSINHTARVSKSCSIIQQRLEASNGIRRNPPCALSFDEGCSIKSYPVLLLLSDGEQPANAPCFCRYRTSQVGRYYDTDRQRKHFRFSQHF